jgi:transcriptional antiterminator RfaH
MQQWYALYTKPRAEYQVSEALQARNIETYLPTIPVWRARRRRLEEDPLFACYLFARLDLQQTGFSTVAWTPGLRYVVGSSEGKPTPVPETVVTYIRHREAEVEGHSPTGLQSGDRIRITEGPFAELDGVFEQHLSGYERAQVLVKVLGRLTRYDVPTEWLRRLAVG